METRNVKAVATATTGKNESTKVQVTNNATEATKKAEELKNELQKKQAELKRCLAELERKKEISEKRDVFLMAIENLKFAQNKINESDTFECTNYKLNFINVTNNYNGSAIFGISNKFILLKFIEFITNEINNKVKELEQELMQ